MKRKSKPESVHKFWPILFWYPCRRCQMQFCREWGWQKRFKSINGKVQLRDYVCMECCPTIEEACNVWRRIMSPPPGQYKYGI